MVVHPRQNLTASILFLLVGMQMLPLVGAGTPATLNADGTGTTGSWTADDGNTFSVDDTFTSDNKYSRVNAGAKFFRVTVADTPPALSGGTVTEVKLQIETMVAGHVDDGFTVWATTAGGASVLAGPIQIEGTPGDTISIRDITAAQAWTQAMLNGMEVKVQSTQPGAVDGQWRVDHIAVNVVYSVPPSLGGDKAISVSEGGSVALTNADLAATDSEDASTALTYTVTTAPTDATIKVAGATSTTFTQAQIDSGIVVYHHDGSNDATDSFAVKVTDSDGLSASGTVTVTVAQSNDAPVVTPNTGVTVIHTSTSSAITSAMLGATDDEGDTAAQIVFKPSVGSKEGFLFFDTDGNKVFGAGDKTLWTTSSVLKFTKADIDSGKVRYHAFTTTSTTVDTMSFVVRDSESTPATSATTTFKFTVSDGSPVIQADPKFTVAEGGTITLTTAHLKGLDANTPDAGLTFTITTSSSKGKLYLNTAPLGSTSGVVSKFTQADVTAGKVKYIHAGGENTADSFRVNINDGGTPRSTTSVTITITPVNDAPTAGDRTVSGLEDQAITLDVGSHLGDPKDVDGTVESYRITAVPAVGQLRFDANGNAFFGDDAAITAGTLIALSDVSLSRLQYVPPANAHGNPLTTFTFHAVDDKGAKSTPDNTAKVTVSAINDKPTSADSSVSTDEDVNYVFKTVDFPFTDVDTGAHGKFDHVTISILPLAGTGTLQWNTGSTLNTWTSATANQKMTTSLIADGKFRYVPPADQHGNNFASFRFHVVDEGNEFSTPSNELTITVVSKEDKPTMSSMRLTLDEDMVQSFTESIFGFKDPDAGDSFAYVVVDRLPTKGSLQYDRDGNGLFDDAAVVQGDKIAVGHLVSNRFQFKPGAHEHGTDYAVILFIVEGADGDRSTPQPFTFDVNSVPDEPTGADKTITATEDTPYAFTFADYTYADGDGDSMTASIISTGSGFKGRLTYHGVDVPDGGVVTASTLTVGRLTYTANPNENGVAYQELKFRVMDSTGSQSVKQYTFTINVNPTGDAPTVSKAGFVTTNEDVAYTYKTADFNFKATGTPPKDIDGDTLSAIKIIAFPKIGVLQHDANADSDFSNDPALVLGSEVAATDVNVGRLRYQPNKDAFGTDDTMKFRIRDSGGQLSTVSTHFTMSVVGVQDPPTTADATVTTAEDVRYTFSTTDFAYSDVDGDVFKFVQIVTLPSGAGGNLKWDADRDGDPSNDKAVAFNDKLTVSTLTVGRLTFIPKADASGTPLAQFDFRVVDTSSSISEKALMRINVISQNDPPTSTTTGKVTTLEDTHKTLLLSNFAFSDKEDSTPSSITLESVISNGNGIPGQDMPLGGKLQRDSNRDGTFTSDEFLSVGAVLKPDDLTGGHVRYVPEKDQFGAASIIFRVRDSMGADPVGPTQGILTFVVTPVNDRPTTNDGTHKIREDEPDSATFSITQFQYNDNDSTGTFSRFVVQSIPARGDLCIDDAANVNDGICNGADRIIGINTELTHGILTQGLLAYRPDPNINGDPADNFRFQFKDPEGAASNAATMFITVTSEEDVPSLQRNHNLPNENGDNDGTYNEAADNVGTFNEGATATLTNQHLQAIDPDSTPNEIVYTLRTTSTVGKLFLGSTLLKTGDSFTQKDINDGRVSYTHDGADPGNNFGNAGSGGGGGTEAPDGGAMGAAYDDALVFVLSNGDGSTQAGPFAFFIAVADIVQPPQSANLEITIGEDSTHTFTYLNGNGDMSDPGDADETWIWLDIATLPNRGFLDLNSDGGSDPANPPAGGGNPFVAGDAMAAPGRIEYANAGTKPLPSTAAQDSRDVLNNGHLRFRPAANEFGSPYATFTFEVVRDDPASAGPPPTPAGPVTSTQTYTVTINVIEGPDVPVHSVSTMTINEGDVRVPLTKSVLRYTDEDHSPSQVIYNMRTAPSHGTLYLDTGNGKYDAGEELTPPKKFTQQQANDGRVLYDHNGADNTATDKFEFIVCDPVPVCVGDETSPDYENFVFNIVDVDDPPVITKNSGLTVTEASTSKLTSTHLLTSDPDTVPKDVRYTVLTTAATGTLRLSSTALSVGSTFTQLDINVDNIDFRHAGGEATSDSFGFSVTDGTSTTSSTVKITITQVNDLPTSADRTVSTMEDKAYKFVSGDFAFSDADPGDSFKAVFIAAAPAKGKLEYAPGSSFIQITGTLRIPIEDIAAGKLRYTGAANEFGQTYDTFSFRIEDSKAGRSDPVNKITIDVSSVNDPPQASDDKIDIDEDQVLDFPFAAINVESGETLTYTPEVTDSILTGAILAHRGPKAEDYRYTPPANFVGTEVFDFRVCDNGSPIECDFGTVTINIEAVNDSPGLNAPASASTNEDTALVFKAANGNAITAFDPDGGTPQQHVSLAALHGTLKLGSLTGVTVVSGADGAASLTIRGSLTSVNAAMEGLTYAPTANYHGKDTVSILVDDKHSGGKDKGAFPTASKSISIVIASIPDDPTSADASVTTAEDTPVALSNTLFAFADGDGDAMASIKIGSFTEHKLVLDSNNNGLDAGDPLLGFGDTVSIADLTAGKFYFSPEANRFGTSFSIMEFQVIDATGAASSPANKLTIHVTPVEDIPVTAGATVSTAEDTVLSFQSSHFAFSDGDPTDVLTTVVLGSVPGAGSLQHDANGDGNFGNDAGLGPGSVIPATDLAANRLRFTPVANAFGSPYASFTFQVSDNDGDLSNVGTMLIDVTSVNDLPVAGGDHAIALTESDLGIKLTSADVDYSDVETATASLTVKVVAVPANGILYVDGNGNGLLDAGEALANGASFTQGLIAAGKVLYDHDGAEQAQEILSFEVCDSDGGCSIPASLIFTVAGVNDVPFLTSSATLAVLEGQKNNALDGTFILFGDTDDTDSTLTFEVKAVPGHGSLWYDGDENGVRAATEALSVGSKFTAVSLGKRLMYDHDGSEDATDSFQLDVCDDDAACAGAATFQVAVTPVNDLPTMVRNTPFSVDEHAKDNAIPSANFEAGDVDDTSGSITFRLTKLPADGVLYDDANGDGSDGLSERFDTTSTFTQEQLGGGSIKYAHNGANNPTDGFEFRLCNGSECGGTQSATINIRQLNEPPTPVRRVDLQIDAGEVGAAINGTLLAYEDARYSVGTLTFKIISVPDDGTLYQDLNGNGTIEEAERVTAGSIVQQQAIIDDLFRYDHNDADDAVEAFTFQVCNGDDECSPNTVYRIRVIQPSTGTEGGSETEGSESGGESGQASSDEGFIEKYGIPAAVGIGLANVIVIGSIVLIILIRRRPA